MNKIAIEYLLYYLYMRIVLNISKLFALLLH